MTRLTRNAEPTRTDLDCTECGNRFIALLDFRLDGNHVVCCPHCGHEHCRVIVGGEVTGERFDTRQQRWDVERKHTWKAAGAPIMTSSASAFIRDAWLRKRDD